MTDKKRVEGYMRMRAARDRNKVVQHETLKLKEDGNKNSYPNL